MGSGTAAGPAGCDGPVRVAELSGFTPGRNSPVRVADMRQIAAFMILVALFLLLVGSRFRPSDGDILASVGRLAVEKVRGAMPPAEKVAAPVNALRTGLPQRV